jgi:hypothetical protein
MLCHWGSVGEMYRLNKSGLPQVLFIGKILTIRRIRKPKMKFNKKKLTKKIKAYIRSDVIGSVAMVSILLNVFFFSGVVLFNATNELDVSLYEAAEKNLCVDNYQENLIEEINKSEDPQEARTSFEVECQTGEFTRYFENAVELYLNDTL